MQVTRIPTDPSVYSSNVWFIQGDFNRLEDKNAVIDTGGSGSIVEHIRGLYTGAGKKQVEKVVLTHNHFDHTGGVAALKEAFGSTVLAWSKEKLVDRKLSDGDLLRLGDRRFEVLYTPGHSNDSICLYGWEDRVLFSGDTPVEIKTPLGSYSLDFYRALQRLCNLRIERIYPGHGPIINNAAKVLVYSLQNVLLALKKQGTIA